MAIILDGKILSQKIRDDLKRRLEAQKGEGKPIPISS